MTPALLAPLGLLALASILLPIAIHLARRTEMRPVDFAALRYLDARPRPRQRLRLDEWLLLAVRILLLALVSLLLAGPILWGAEDRRAVVAVFPGIAAPAIGEDVRGVWLAPGFSSVADASPPRPERPATLIRRLDAALAPGVKLTIIVPPVLGDLDAERPRLSREVTWRVVNAPVPAAAPTVPPPIAIRHAPPMRGAVRYFRAAATALAPSDRAPDIAALDQPIPSAIRHIIWLDSGELPASILDRAADGATVLAASDTLLALEAPPRTVWRDPEGQQLAIEQRHGKGRVLRLTRTIDPAAMPILLDATFPDRLAELLDPAPPPARASAADHAPLTGTPAWPQPPLDLAPWFALAIALVFAIERLLATRPRRVIA
ncbi:BatA domain-containing protein [Sphingomonas sp. S1-29]|uniref:BatA domain-containing protein n=1 Tax=Sphingomonas sp. S1-29 TaxID=2991074 RepID=UPI002240510E|nr:BatA domain-containing protein [Sphingomonas sp. S1-29]UZK70352.1 BatA domain-containing protein [Sphingomonas sp. S1-29]